MAGRIGPARPGPGPLSRGRRRGSAAPRASTDTAPPALGRRPAPLPAPSAPHSRSGGRPAGRPAGRQAGRRARRRQEASEEAGPQPRPLRSARRGPPPASPRRSPPQPQPGRLPAGPGAAELPPAPYELAGKGRPGARQRGGRAPVGGRNASAGWEGRWGRGAARGRRRGRSVPGPLRTWAPPYLGPRRGGRAGCGAPWKPQAKKGRGAQRVRVVVPGGYAEGSGPCVDIQGSH